MVLFIMATGDHLRQDSDRVSYSAAICTTMQVAVSAGYFHLDIREAANANIQRRIFHA